MKNNVGNIDRIIRLLLSVVLVILWFTGTLTGTIGIVALVLAGVFTLTAAIGFCPLYAIFGLNTCPAKK
ncbi:MAG: DUF2892 domain-containing protein [Bacteroidia bacterium]|nr:DUF2892 domain-containing protein [Bacteroidia bacterium]